MAEFKGPRTDIGYGRRWFIDPDSVHPWKVMVDLGDLPEMKMPPVEIASFTYKPFAELLVAAGNAMIEEQKNG